MLHFSSIIIPELNCNLKNLKHNSWLETDENQNG